MKKLNLFTMIFVTICSFTACGNKNHKHDNTKNMNTSKIKNTTVKQAIDAFQSKDVNKWLFLFSEDAVLLDDGKPRDFKEFSTHAIKIENFTSIDKIEENGNLVYGHFHSDKWGDFKAYFKFHFNEQGKINMLEIGQADY